MVCFSQQTWKDPSSRFVHFFVQVTTPCSSYAPSNNVFQVGRDFLQGWTKNAKRKKKQLMWRNTSLMWWYFDHAFQPSNVSLQCPCLCFSKQQLAKHLTFNSSYTHAFFEIQESGPGQIWWTFSQCSWQSLAKTHSAMSRVIFNQLNGTIWSNTKDEQKRNALKNSLPPTRKHENNSF